jgi:hypothetical protein
MLIEILFKNILGQFQYQPPIGWLKKYKMENKTLLYGTATYIHNCITSPHSCHPHLDTCRTVTLVFVVSFQRTVPPSYAVKSVSCFWYPPCTELMVTQSVRDSSIQSSPRSFVEILQKVLISWNDVSHASIGRLFLDEFIHQSQLSVVLDHLRQAYQCAHPWIFCTILSHNCHS